MALTGLAIAGVFILIGYRVSQSGKPPAETAAITLPAGARVVSTAVSADRIAVTVEAGGRTDVLLYDLYTLQPRGKLSLGAP
ncbi:hypothetical protein GJW-30_1_04198 [Variibacter gotjawalensis]|uniref:Uncharacterized protein n=2 Tax=Variibacter gotjawalensis TaxID=1333996 RepID=A0A0S3Q0B0_9BRAD|nr:hypothetical protein GJW-30_1_04198 [Variibacter gotjawalensis]